MIDREKVIKAYEDFINGYECFCTSDDYEYEMHKAVLSMLKEQDEIIKELQNAYGYLQKQFFNVQDKLLKEQEAKPMIENERGWNCPSCGMKLIGKTASGYPCDLIDLPEDEPIHFCPMCGQAVKWE